jgi:hypothetical protein
VKNEYLSLILSQAESLATELHDEEFQLADDQPNRCNEYYVEIQGLDPKSDDYFRWPKNVIMFLILPVLNSFELKE